MNTTTIECLSLFMMAWGAYSFKRAVDKTLENKTSITAMSGILFFFFGLSLFTTVFLRNVGK